MFCCIRWGGSSFLLLLENVDCVSSVGLFQFFFLLFCCCDSFCLLKCYHQNVDRNFGCSPFSSSKCICGSMHTHNIHIIHLNLHLAILSLFLSCWVYILLVYLSITVAVAVVVRKYTFVIRKYTKHVHTINNFRHFLLLQLLLLLLLLLLWLL